MARAHAVNESLREQAVRGLARSLSRPAYQRLLEAEPLLRRAVPILIVVFLVTVAAGAAMQIVGHRQQALTEAQDLLVLMTGMTADNLAKHSGKELKAKIGELLQKSLPQRALVKGRRYFVTDAAGGVVASIPENSSLPPGQISNIGRSFADLADRARVADFTLPDNSEGIAAVRNLSPPLGQLVVVQSTHDALDRWRSDCTLTVTLVTTTGFVLLILGFAFHWQADAGARGRRASTRWCARASTPRSIAAAAGCGTGISRAGAFTGRIRCSRFWGSSRARSFCRSAKSTSLVHPDDGSLYDIAALLADGNDKTSIARSACAMRTATGSGCARAPRSCGRTATTAPHLIGIAVDVTEETATRRTHRHRRHPAARRRREHFGGLRVVGRREIVWCCAIPNIQQLHGLPAAATRPARLTRTSRRRPSAADPDAAEIRGLRRGRRRAPSRRSSHDGRWLKISERRTKDGGFVSVGTDITADQAPRGKADRERKAADGDRRRSSPLAADARISGAAARRTRAEIRRGEKPRRGRQPGQIRIPRQHEPRAAHAAERHHRLFRDHGIGHVRRARLAKNTANIARTSARAAAICSTSSTTFSTCRRSRPAACGSRSRTCGSTSSWTKPCG